VALRAYLYRCHRDTEQVRMNCVQGNTYPPTPPTLSLVRLRLVLAASSGEQGSAGTCYLSPGYESYFLLDCTSGATDSK